MKVSSYFSDTGSSRSFIGPGTANNAKKDIKKPKYIPHVMVGAKHLR